MTLEYKRITLDAASRDSDGMLVLRDGLLLAVVSQLSDMHDELTGYWFIETVFNSTVATPRSPFPDLGALDHWLCGQIA